MQYRIRRTGDDSSTPHQSNESWERNTLRDVLLEAYKEQRRTRFWRNFWRIVWVLIFLSLLINIRSCSDSEKPSGHGRFVSASGEHTAVISLTGEIGNEYGEDQVALLRESLEAAYSNSAVKGIIIRANSPGGSPVVSNTAFNEIRRLKAEHKDIPLYVVAEDMCASGCYYIASAADKIYADPSSLVGSIGVIGGGFDVTGLMDKLGIKRRLKIAGNNKGMGDPFTPETPEQAKIWEGMLTDIHREFINAVKLGRGKRLKEKENPDLFSGRVYSGTEAKQVGLIDDFGSIYTVSRDVIQAPEMVDYTAEEDDFRKLFRRGLRSEVSSAIEAVGNRLW
ncbi:S49 family peptidase [Neisseria montereyensis]|uniref:S49 family peptidase n=1 Tax=Neisseria montereyensis TaxID=2973938 RepID=A0ABT2FFS2_9NEIS|nr:S49 family peptidase [Neisseria montereyensis]MCS4534303.1 S49 family peptidase [Neisseria montereyensis]